MSVTSLSFTFVNNTYTAPSAKQTAPVERGAPAEKAHQHPDGESRPAGRPNRLVEAMMSALRELGFGNEASQPAPAAAPASAPAAATSTAADAAAALATGEGSAATALAQSAAASATNIRSELTDSAAANTESAEAPQVSVESAVRQFAYELFNALRQTGRGESSERGSARIDGDGGRRHHGGRREGYGDMAQRLNALSQTFAAPAAVAAPGATPVSTSISITLTIQNGVVQQNGAARSPAEAVTTNAAVAESAEPGEVAAVADASDAGEALPATPSAATTAQQVARNPLLDAFSQLFGALKPQAAQTDMGDKLRTFLQTLAQAMRPESMNHGMPMPQVGALVNLTA